MCNVDLDIKTLPKKNFIPYLLLFPGFGLSVQRLISTNDSLNEHKLDSLTLFI